MRVRVLLFCGFLALAACTEIPPKINPILDQGVCPLGNAQEVAQQKRGVLIEEFSGVRCANCPAGSAAIQGLLNQYGDQLVAVSIHTGFFARPYEDNLYDFRTAEGDGLLNLLKAPIGFPSAVINRKLFDGETDLQLGLADWAGYIAQEVKEAPVFKLLPRPTYDAASRMLTLEISIFPQRDFTGEDLRLSLMLTENKVTDVQLTPSGKESDFEHNHVFRTMLTNFDGNPLPADVVMGKAACLSYQAVLDPAWLVENCRLVAFIHRGGANKEVLQAVEASLLP